MAVINARRADNVYEWMILKSDELVDAIAADGRVGGPQSDPLLEEAHRMISHGKLKSEAKKLLQLKLKDKGLFHLMGDNGD